MIYETIEVTVSTHNVERNIPICDLVKSSKMKS